MTDQTTPAADRTPEAGRIDQANARSGGDALMGHFVRVDLNAKGVQKAYADAGLKDHRGDYGVFLEPVSVDSNGRPENVVVRLRDETQGRIVVPYDSLRRAEPGGR